MPSAKELYEQFVNITAESRVDADKFFEKKTKAAGTRLRKHLMDLKKLAGVIR